MKYLFLDLDGVLTTSDSRITAADPSKFDTACVAAIERLLLEVQPAVIIHSSWRKLPEAPPPPWEFPPAGSWWYWNIDWFRELCRFHGANELSNLVFDEAPYKMSSTRGFEIQMWIEDNGKEGDSYVILDDEISTMGRFADRDDVLIIQTDDYYGLTQENVDRILKWWK